jgi:hypothetical protein
MSKIMHLVSWHSDGKSRYYFDFRRFSLRMPHVLWRAYLNLLIWIYDRRKP